MQVGGAGKCRDFRSACGIKWKFLTCRCLTYDKVSDHKNGSTFAAENVELDGISNYDKSMADVRPTCCMVVLQVIGDHPPADLCQLNAMRSSEIAIGSPLDFDRRAWSTVRALVLRVNNLYIIPSGLILWTSGHSTLSRTSVFSKRAVRIVNIEGVIMIEIRCSGSPREVRTF